MNRSPPDPSAVAPTPTWNHPLFGADPLTLVRLLAGNGALPLKVWPLAAALLAAAALRVPLSLGERLWAGARARRLPPAPAPVFILGHWRSGTTHLFNLMSRDAQFAWADPFATGMPWDFLLLGRLLGPLLRRALPADRYIDNVAVNADSPQEDEIALAAMQAVSYYHGLYFPRAFERHYRRGVFLEGLSQAELTRWERALRHFGDKCRLAGRGQTLLIKNPVYTGRIAQLRKIWPEARFVHIRRNPYVVFQSTRRFYRRLLPKLALQPYDPALADALILETYPRMLADLERDRAELPAGHYTELSFETLEREPMAALEGVYRDLRLPGFEAAATRFAAHLGEVRDYRKNRHGFPADAIDLVDRHWGAFVRAWGYEAPR